MSVAIDLLYACNSRCATCRIYERPARPLSLVELEQLFRSLGRSPAWVTLTGGEPFLRRDLVEIALALYRHCRPAVVAIATNGTLPPRVAGAVHEIARRAPRTRWVVNVSLDDVGERHDRIRGTPGNYARALETLRLLQRAPPPNLTVGIHTCLSRHNAPRFAEIEAALAELGADSHIAELAEVRGELDNAGLDFAASEADYRRAVRRLVARGRGRRARGVARVVQALRLAYYDFSLRVLELEAQPIPCMAGFASAQIGAEGDVWTCSTRAEPMGNLREAGSDFRKVWRSAAAQRLRESVRRGDCACPMAGPAYTTLLSHPPSLLRIARDYLALGRARSARAS